MFFLLFLFFNNLDTAEALRLQTFGLPSVLVQLTCLHYTGIMDFEQNISQGNQQINPTAFSRSRCLH